MAFPSMALQILGSKSRDDPPSSGGSSHPLSWGMFLSYSVVTMSSKGTTLQGFSDSFNTPKVNIASEKSPSQKESGLPTIIFQGLC